MTASARSSPARTAGVTTRALPPGPTITVCFGGAGAAAGAGGMLMPGMAGGVPAKAGGAMSEGDGRRNRAIASAFIQSRPPLWRGPPSPGALPPRQMRQLLGDRELDQAGELHADEEH